MEVLHVPGKLDSLSQIAAYVLDAAKIAGLTSKATHSIRLSVDEIATNIATHGYSEAGPTGFLDISAHIDEKGLTIVLEDTGRCYDPTKFDRLASLDLPLDKREVGGLGVYLAKHKVDQFRYERVGELNCHTFFIRRESPADD